MDEDVSVYQMSNANIQAVRSLSQNRTAKQDRGDFSSFLMNLPRVGDGQDTVEEGRSRSRNQTSKGALQNKCSQVPPAPSAEG